MSAPAWIQELVAYEETYGIHAGFLSRLTKAPLLTAEEEIALSRRARDGCARSRQKLVESNMRLVVNIAKRYSNPAVPLEDLIQEGAIGLMTAVERYDPEKGFRFSTYATHWIRQAIGRAVDCKGNTIRLPSHVSQTVRKIDRARRKLLRDLGREPSTEQIAEALGVSAQRLQQMVKASQDLVSLDVTVGEGDSTTLGSLIRDKERESPESHTLNEEAIAEFQRALSQLTERERMVLEYKLQMLEPTAGTYRQHLSREFSCSSEQVRKIELSAIRKLRNLADLRALVGLRALECGPEE